MSKMIPVEGHKNLFRDQDSGAIINHDNNSYNNYLILIQKIGKFYYDIAL